MKQLFALTIVLSTVLASVSTANAQFVQEKRIDASESYINSQVMRILVLDGGTHESISTDVIVRGLNPRKPIEMKAVADTTFAIRNYRLYTVSCVEPGFMYYSEKFWPEEKELHIQKVNLLPLAVGLSTDLREVSFLGDKTEIYHKSKPALDELIEFLTVNPTVNISVIGHVNGPDNAKSQKFYNKVSLQRSEAIIEYLVEKGISSKRMKYHGYGKTDPIASNDSKAGRRKNQRVELKIIKVE